MVNPVGETRNVGNPCATSEEGRGQDKRGEDDGRYALVHVLKGKKRKMKKSVP